jgi:16S rRNA C967 or C1407 C5-methylase (RsmB/RsmF family)
MPGRGRGQKRKGGDGDGGGRGGGRGGGDDRLLKRDFKKSRDDVWDPAKSRKPNGAGAYNTGFVKENANFEEYYKAQKIVPEEEWDAFIECLKTPLPTSFRINGRYVRAAERSPSRHPKRYSDAFFSPAALQYIRRRRADGARHRTREESALLLL